MGNRFAGWTQKDVDLLNGTSTHNVKKHTKNHAPKIKKDVPDYVGMISGALQALKVNHVLEYKFLHDRRFKFDLAIPLLRWLDTKFSSSILRDWDPVLEERLLELWLSCQNQQPVKEQDKAVMAQLRERLCCLNPIRVLS